MVFLPANFAVKSEPCPWRRSLYLYSLYYCVQKEGTGTLSLNKGVWRLLDEQNRESAEIVCNKGNVAS
jgi:hypothetical protein